MQGVVPVSKPDFIPVQTEPVAAAKAPVVKSGASAVAPQGLMAAVGIAMLLALLL